MEQRLHTWLSDKSSFFIATIFIFVFVLLYVTTNRIPTFYGPFELPKLFYEDQIPLIPETTLVYLSLFLYVVISSLLLPRHALNQAAIIFMYILIFHTLVFIFFPTIYPRSELASQTGIFNWIMNTIHTLDAPRNCFPSLHVSLPFTLAFVWKKIDKRVGNIFIFWSILIAISTLTTKQHYILDVFGAIFISFLLVKIKFKNPQPSFL